MLPYQVFINLAALDTAPRSGMRRIRVMRFIYSLAENPFCAGDFSETDEAGTKVFVKIIEGFAITFWADHPVSEVKVTHIKPADK